VEDDKFYKTRKFSLIFIKLEKLVWRNQLRGILQREKGCVSRKLAENKRKISPELGEKSTDSTYVEIHLLSVCAWEKTCFEDHAVVLFAFSSPLNTSPSRQLTLP
jgi:hypothetical protein